MCVCLCFWIKTELKQYIIFGNKFIKIFFFFLAYVDTYMMPMTPQPRRPPALPVVFDNSCPPFPRSSTISCTTTARPTILWTPDSDIILSTMLTVASPWAFASMLPRSPTCLVASAGAPWVA